MNSPLILNTELFFTSVTILMTFKSPAVKQIYLQIFRKTKRYLNTKPFSLRKYHVCAFTQTNNVFLIQYINKQEQSC